MAMTTATSDVTAERWAARAATLRPVHPGRGCNAEEWSVVGEPLRDSGLRERVVAVLDDVAALPGCEDVEPVGDGRDFARVLTALGSAHERLASMASETRITVLAPAAAQLVELLTELGRLRVQVTQAQIRQRNDRYAAIRNALSRLHGIDSVEQMLVKAPEELCRCGFDRVIVSAIEESTWRVESVHVKGDPEWADEIARVGREHPTQIDHTLIESEIMRRRTPVLVRDAQHDPRTNAAIGQASLSRSYVAAPIMPNGRIIGLLHADCYNSRRHVDEDDLAALWMFTEGFGYAYQRTALSERLRSARNEIQRMARDIATAADDVCTARTALGRPQPHRDAKCASSPVAVSLAAETSIKSRLSHREIEVVSLMAEGKSNRAIATHLVISEGTVKTHVKHILRKLKASNRAEAVFRYMRMTAVHGGPPAAR